MFRHMTDRTLRGLAAVGLAGNYVAAAVAAGIIAAWAGWIAPPTWLAVTAFAVVLALFLAGRLAEGEQVAREQELEHEGELGYWPRRDERDEREQVLGCGGVHEPTPVDDEGEPVEGSDVR